MKISVPGQQAGQGNLNIGKPQHESTRLSDIFFCELSNVSSQLDGDSSVSEYFQIQREHLIVQPNDRMNETTVSSHYNSDNLFSNTNSKFTSELSSPDTSKAFDRPATPHLKPLRTPVLAKISSPMNMVKVIRLKIRLLDLLKTILVLLTNHRLRLLNLQFVRNKNKCEIKLAKANHHVVLN